MLTAHSTTARRRRPAWAPSPAAAAPRRGPGAAFVVSLVVDVSRARTVAAAWRDLALGECREVCLG